MPDTWRKSVRRVWKPVASVLTAFVLVGVAYGVGGPIVSFIATDVEVAVAVKVHEDFINPKVMELAGSIEILAKGQARAELSNLNAAIQRADTQLFDVRERRKIAPQNLDARARELQLIRLLNGLTQDQVTAKCILASMDDANRRC